MRAGSEKVRPLAPDEMEDAFRLWSLAFERGSRNMDHWRKGADAWPAGTIAAGIRPRDTLEAAFAIISFRCFFGQSVVLPMGGIGAVATLPSSRGKGYAGSMMSYSLSTMREAGQPISMLAPFSWEFYQAYGWDWVGMARHYSLPARALKASDHAERVREAASLDHAAIRETYARFCRRYRGALLRTDRQWDDILADSGSQYASVYIYEGDSGIDGYLAYRGGDRSNLTIREFIALTPSAQRGLLALLRRQEMQFGRFSWKAPSDDLLWSQLYDWEMETKLTPVFMGRVVDLRAALAAWVPAEPLNAGMTIEIADQQAPWNQRTWRIECEEGRISVKKGHGEPQISLDIRAFSQAFFGEPGLPQLRRAGRVVVGDEAAFESLCRLLAGPPTWMNDFF